MSVGSAGGAPGEGMGGGFSAWAGRGAFMGSVCRWRSAPFDRPAVAPACSTAAPWSVRYGTHVPRSKIGPSTTPAVAAPARRSGPGSASSLDAGPGAGPGTVSPGSPEAAHGVGHRAVSRQPFAAGFAFGASRDAAAFGRGDHQPRHRFAAVLALTHALPDHRLESQQQRRGNDARDLELKDGMHAGAFRAGCDPLLLLCPHRPPVGAQPYIRLADCAIRQLSLIHI